VLMNFVPKERRHEAVPCRHIPLNDLGETVDSIYRTGTNEEIEETLQSWLLKTIGQLEEQSERPRLEKNKGMKGACTRRSVGIHQGACALPLKRCLV
jgi:hypothetical protein